MIELRHKAQLSVMALKHGTLLKAVDGQEKAFAAAQIVLGVFPDEGTSDGIGVKVLKWDTLCSEQSHRSKPEVVTLTAIPCRDLDDALSMWESFGDG